MLISTFRTDARIYPPVNKNVLSGVSHLQWLSVDWIWNMSVSWQTCWSISAAVIRWWKEGISKISKGHSGTLCEMWGVIMLLNLLPCWWTPFFPLAQVPGGFKPGCWQHCFLHVIRCDSDAPSQRSMVCRHVQRERDGFRDNPLSLLVDEIHQGFLCSGKQE